MRSPPPSVPPGAARSPGVLGSLREFRSDLLGFLGRLAREEGEVAAFRLGRRQFVSVTAAELVQTVLSDGERFGILYREITRRVLGDGLITSEDASWLERRRQVQPAFSDSSVQRHTVIMGETASRLVEGWRDGTRVDVHDEMADLTTEVVCRTLFGVDLPAPVRSEIRGALAAMAAHLLARVTSAIPVPGWVPTPGSLRYRRAARRLDQVAAEILARAQESRASTLLNRAPGPHGRLALTREMRDHIVSFLLAGLEGTALTLSWTWHLLAESSRDRRAPGPSCSRGGGQSSACGRGPAAAQLRRASGAGVDAALPAGLGCAPPGPTRHGHRGRAGRARHDR